MLILKLRNLIFQKKTMAVGVLFPFFWRAFQLNSKNFSQFSIAVFKLGVFEVWETALFLLRYLERMVLPGWEFLQLEDQGFPKHGGFVCPIQMIASRES